MKSLFFQNKKTKHKKSTSLAKAEKQVNMLEDLKKKTVVVEARTKYK